MTRILSSIGIIGIIFLTSASGFSNTIQKPEPRLLIVSEASVMFRLTSKNINAYKANDNWSFFPNSIIITSELGLLKRIGHKHAIGASGFFALNTNISQVGVRIRYRLQLGQQTYLYVSPGLILGETCNTGHKTHLPAFTGQLCLGLSKWLMLKSEVQVTKRPGFFSDRRISGRIDGTDISFSGGVAIGGTPGLVYNLIGGAIIGVAAITTAIIWSS